MADQNLQKIYLLCEFYFLSEEQDATLSSLMGLRGVLAFRILSYKRVTGVQIIPNHAEL